MRSPEEIRAEIERLRAKSADGQPYDAWKAVYLSALEWVIDDEQPKPTQCRYCRGTGWKSEAFAMGAYDSYQRLCWHCKGTGDEHDKPKETDRDD